MFNRSPDTSPTPGSRPDPREVLGLVALLTVLFLWSLAPLAGYDFWFYLAVGRDIWETGRIPWSESYLGTTATFGFGRYADAAWLGNLLCYLAFAAAGPLGLVALKSGLLALTTGLSYLGCRLGGLPPFWSGAWSALALWTVRGRFEMRTYLFTDLCLAALVLVLMTAERGAALRRLVLATGLLFAFWTNLHQGIIAGYVVLGCWVVFGRRCPRERVLLGVAGGLASLARPHALSFPAFLIDHFSNNSAISGVVEWAPPTTPVLLYQLGPMLLCLGGVFVSASLKGRGKLLAPPLAFGLAALAFAFLAVRSIRSVSELLPVVCPLAAPYFPRLSERSVWKGAASGALALLFWWTASPPPHLQALRDTASYPSTLVDALPSEPGQVFNSFEFGNYLVYRQRPPFLHGMTMLYQEQLIVDFQAVLNPTPRRQEILEQFQVTSALLHHPTEQDATLSLVDSLAESADWKLELWDDTGLLFVRGNREQGLTEVRPWRTPSWADADSAELELRALLVRRPSATAHRLLSELLLAQGKVDEAAQQARLAIALSPAFQGAWAQLGRCLARQNDPQQVLIAAEGAVQANWSSAPAQTHLALLLAQKAQSGGGWSDLWRARYHARLALWIDPRFAPARQIWNAL